MPATTSTRKWFAVATTMTVVRARWIDASRRAHGRAVAAKTCTTTQVAQARCSDGIAA
jgi:hypothetical protein